MLRSRTALAAVALTAVTVTAGCVQQKAPGVAIKALNANIVFGVASRLEKPAPPPNFTPAIAPVEAVDALPPQITSSKPHWSPPKYSPIELPKPKAAECPDALLNAFPDEASPTNVPDDRSPQVGIYRWKRRGTVKGANGEFDVSGLEERALKNLTQEAADPTDDTRRRYTFEVAEPLIGSSDIALVTYRVDTHAEAVQAFNPVGQDNLPRAGEPERGVVLKSIRYVDANGNKTGQASFTPTTGLLLLPLPILDGEQYTSVAVDPVTQQTWRFDGQVQGHELVDACGTMIQAWKTVGTLTVSGAEGGTRQATFVVAPQLGGIVIGEYLSGAYDDKTIDVKLTIGQKVPTPLPEDGK